MARLPALMDWGFEAIVSAAGLGPLVAEGDDVLTTGTAVAAAGERRRRMR